jgi:hypothetical protein
VNHPEVTTRRIAVILGPGGASRYLLDQLGPLLATDRDIELQGMFFREANIQHAAELPFVKELCRVTFAVREFDTGQFERALALRMRTARQALAVLADRKGVSHTFLDVRGSAVGLLKKAIDESDITAFEPARPPLAQAIRPGKGVAHGPRIAALLCDSTTGESVLRTAAGLAGGDLNSLAILIFPEPDESPGVLRALYRDYLEGEPGHVRLLTQGGFNDLALTLRELFASMLVVPATPAMTSDKSLQFLREQVRCPVCVVREWED